MPSPYMLGELFAGGLVLGSDNVIRLMNLRLYSSGAYISTATVTATVTDQAGTAVTTTISLTGGTLGNYDGVLVNSAALITGNLYKITVTATSAPYKGVFEAWVIAGRSVGDHNWFGASIEDIARLLPGVAIADFGNGDEQRARVNLSGDFDEATRRVLEACPARVYDLLHRVVGELIVERGTAGQTTCYLSLPAAVSTSLYLFKNYGECPVNPDPNDALASAEISNVTRVADTSSPYNMAWRVTLATALALGDTIHATYDLDVTSALYCFGDLADIVRRLVVANAGGRIYSMSDTVWSLVSESGKVADERLQALADGKLIPTQLRRLKLCADFERTSGSAFGSVPCVRS